MKENVDVKAMSDCEWRSFIRKSLHEIDGELVRINLDKQGSDMNLIYQGKHLGCRHLAMSLKRSSQHQVFMLSLEEEALNRSDVGTNLRTIVNTSTVCGKYNHPANFAAKLCERHGIQTTGELDSERTVERLSAEASPFDSAKVFQKMAFDLLDAFAKEHSDAASELQDEMYSDTRDPGTSRVKGTL